MTHSHPVNLLGLGHPPQTLISTVGCAPLRKDSHLVPLAWDPLGQLDSFGSVTLEVQPERATAGQRLELPLQVGAQLGIRNFKLGN